MDGGVPGQHPSRTAENSDLSAFSALHRPALKIRIALLFFITRSGDTPITPTAPLSNLN